MSFSGYFRRCKNFFGRTVTISTVRDSPRFLFHLKRKAALIFCIELSNMSSPLHVCNSAGVVNYQISQQFLAYHLTFYIQQLLRSDFTSSHGRLFLPVLPSVSALIPELLLLFCTLIGGTATVRTVGLLGSVSGATHATRGSQF